MACVVMERCDKDNTYNDKHTSHDASDNDNGASCIEDAAFLVAKSVSQADLSDIYFFPASISTIMEIVFGNTFGETAVPRYWYDNVYTSAETGSPNALRAPPYSFI